MTIFDQRNQNVQSQLNINFSNVESLSQFIKEIEKLQNELRRITEMGLLDKEVSVDVESQLKKASINAENSEPDKNKVVKYLENAKDLIGGVTSAKSLFDSISQAVESISKLF